MVLEHTQGCLQPPGLSHCSLSCQLCSYKPMFPRKKLRHEVNNRTEAQTLGWIIMTFWNSCLLPLSWDWSSSGLPRALLQ
jgi:hypothetical protein